MNDHQSKWHSEELSRTYLEGVRGAIPGANLQLEVLNKVVAAWSPAQKIILDLGCGDGALGRMLLDENPEAHLVFADFSDPMLDALRKKIGDDKRATVVKADFATPAWLECLTGGKTPDVVVSGFAIHHQPDHRKRELYAEIFGCLSDGGVFLNLEHVSSATSAGEALFDGFFVDHLVHFQKRTAPGKTRQEIEKAYSERPDKLENILAPVETQCEWLRRTGFQDVDCFFKCFELALFGGRKPASTKSWRRES
jgi:tRNA (cmo5U34)-methyltransferase